MKIGIFWYDQDRVIGIAHHFDQNDADSLGLIDSDYNHVQYWEKLRVENSHLKNIEYEEIPRGRIIFNTKKDQPMIYMDSKLFKKSIAKKIAEFFELDFDQIIWKKDPHYRTK